MTKKDIIHIEDLFQQASVSGKPEDYSNILSELNKITGSEDALIDYYIGLAYYSNPDEEEPVHLKLAEKYFKKALSIDEDMIQARIYLAYCYFDKGWYKASSENFQDVIFKHFELLESEGQHWRLINMAELLSVCQLHLNQMTNFVENYKLWKLMYYTWAEKDNFYFPRDLVIHTANFLQMNGSGLSNSLKRHFKLVSFELIRIIKGGSGYEDIYKDELKMLKDWDGQLSFNKSLFKV